MKTTFKLDETVMIRRSEFIGIIVGTDYSASKYLVKLGTGRLIWCIGNELMTYLN